MAKQWKAGEHIPTDYINHLEQLVEDMKKRIPVLEKAAEVGKQELKERRGKKAGEQK
jgi:hypothetical protein